MNRNYRALLGRAMTLLLGATMLAIFATRGLTQDAPASADAAETADIDAEQTREELQAMEEETLARIESLESGVDLEAAEGYAIFDATRGGVVITGVGGTGIAHNNNTGEDTYMHLGGGGIGLGAGLENYQLLLVFHEPSAYENFIDGQWAAGISGQAVAGEFGVSEEGQSVKGVDLYRLSDEGLIVQADVTGMRFWPSEELNEAA